MSGLFGTLGVMARSLQTQQQAIATTGHNISNANNPAYARQRVAIQASLPTPSPIGMMGTGVEATAVLQIRNYLVDGQVQAETSALGYWEAQQQALEYAQASLGQSLNRTSAAGGADQPGLAAGLTELFNAFQSLSTNPTSTAERQVLLMKAANLATQFNQITQRLDGLWGTLNSTVSAGVTDANRLITDVAGLNEQIAALEMRTGGVANDLRDLRQQKVEELAKFTKIDTAQQPNGAVNVTIGGVLMVSDQHVLDTLDGYDAGGGQILLRAANAGTALPATSGSLAATIEVRDGTLATLSTQISELASRLITTVNQIHTTGFSLTGTTGAAFFTGTDSRTIGINSALLDDPARIQASGTSGAVGDNQVALALAQLAQQSHASLGNQTFSQRYHQSVATLGQALATANGRLADEQVVHDMLARQRASISGVSVEEEMTNLTTYQRAFEASARVMTVVDGLLETLINIKR